MGGADGLLALSVGQGETGLELLADDPGRVALGDLHPGGDDVAGQRVRAVLLDVGRAAAEPPDHLRLSREPGSKSRSSRLLPIPASPTTRRRDTTLVDDVEETFLQEPDLAGPADRARLDALDDAELVQPESARSLGHDELGVDRRVEPLSSRPGTGAR